MTRVLIVDDQRTAREVMEIAVKQSNKYFLERTIVDAGNAYLHCMNGKVDLVLMDVYTLDGENGIEAAAKIKKDFPRIKIIIVTSMPEESFIRKAREAGCESFWYKDVGVEDLLSVMDKNHGWRIRLSRRCPCNQNRACQEYGVHKKRTGCPA